MKINIERIRKPLQKPVVTPLALIIYLVNVIYVIIILVEEAKWSSAIQLTLTTLQLFAGMKISDVKDWLIQMKQILKAPVDPLTKLNKIMEVVMHGCAVANILWEEVNIMQGTDPGQIAPNTEIEKL